MLCSLCRENEAVICFEQNNSSGKVQIALCDECASSYGLAVHPTMPSVETLNKIMEDVLTKQRADDKDSKVVCPICTTSLFDVKAQEKLGCPYCYTFFKEALNTIRREKYGVLSDSFFSVPGGEVDISCKRQELEKELLLASESEDYEKAEKIKRRLDALKAKDKLGSPVG